MGGAEIHSSSCVAGCNVMSVGFECRECLSNASDCCEASKQDVCRAGVMDLGCVKSGALRDALSCVFLGVLGRAITLLVLAV